MKTSKKIKDLAWKLYQQGKTTDDIAKHCKVSQRTMQRWFNEFGETSLVVAGFGETPDSEDVQAEVVSPIFAEPLPALEKIANLEPGETLDLTLSSRLAIRLLNLAENAIATVEDCLANSELKPSDRLKAAGLAGEWVGLADRDRRSIFNQVAGSCGADLETVNVESSYAVVKSQKLLTAQKKLEEKREKELAAEEEKISEYNRYIYDYFWLNRTLPDELNQDFDEYFFLDSLCDDEAYHQALEALRDRGYDIDCLS